MRRALTCVAVTILVAACGGGGSSTPTNPTPQPQPQANRAPTITNMQATPTFGIAGITQFTFSSSATDADGDTVSYSWEFADGNTRTGASVTHNYSASAFGTGNVRLTVTDGRGGTVSETRQVTVGNVGGEWSGTIRNTIQVRASFAQNASGNVTGTWSASGGGVVPVTGVLDPAAFNRIDGNANFVLRFKITGGGGPGGFNDFTVDGQMNTTHGNTLSGGARGSGFNGDPFVLNRIN